MSTTYNTSFVDNIQLPDNNAYPIRAGAIPYGEVDSTSTSTAFTATVNGIYNLQDGVCMLLKNGQVTSASGFTININNLGAKPVYSNLATGNDQTPTEPTRDTTIFNINYTMLFVYTTTLVDGGAWICYRGYDANTNTIGYQLRTNSGNLEASDTGYRYRLWFTSADSKKWVPANTSTSTNATTARTMNTRPINPFGPIVYNSTNGTVNSGERPAVGTLWQQYALTIGYSYVISLTAWDPVYVQCTPQSDGSAVMNAIVKALPTNNDGKIYIYLGIAYSATAMELRIEHPVFYHDGTGIRIWTGKVIPTKTSDLTNDGDGTSAFATMADIGSLGGGTITAVKTTAGTHSAINVTSGAANFNVPTKTSHLTNDSGFITSSSVPSASALTPLMDGTAAVGTSTAFARGDHVHPSDTSKVDINSTSEYPEEGYINNADGVITLRSRFSDEEETYSSISLMSGDIELSVSRVDTETGPQSFNASIVGDTFIVNSGRVDFSQASTVEVPTPRASSSATTKAYVDSLVSGVLHYKGTKATTSALPSSGNTTGDVWHITADGSEWAWDGSAWQELGTAVDLSNYPTFNDLPSQTAAAVTGISIANHSTGSIYGVSSSTTSVTGVQSTTTTASKATSATAISVPNVTSAGSASNWVFQNITVPIKAASATTVPIKNTSATSIPNVTAVGSGSASLTMSMDTTDTKKLNITFSHTHTPPTLGTAISITGVQSSTTSVTGVQSTTTTASHVKSGGNGTAPTIGTAISIPQYAFSDVTVPIKNTSATTVPIKNTSATTVVTGNTHTITDNGHSHTI